MITNPLTTPFDDIEFRIGIVKRLTEKLKKIGSLSSAEEISLVGNVRILDAHFDIGDEDEKAN